MDNKVKRHTRSVTEKSVIRHKKKIPTTKSQRKMTINQEMVKQWNKLMEEVEKATCGENT